MKVSLPLRTVSEANVKEHWAVKGKRAKTQKNAAYLKVRTLLPDIKPVIVVRITRKAPRRLDDDNLARSNKAIRDGIARALRVDDATPLVKWEYAQEKNKPKTYEVVVEIEYLEAK